METEKVILDTSKEAAHIQTVTGWVSSNGRFWGDDERMARYDGCTHRKCTQCENIVPIHGYTICPDCQKKKRDSDFLAMEAKKWDKETPLCLFDSDTYFWNQDDLEDYCEINSVRSEDLRLVVCKPLYAYQIDPNEYFCDVLPEDGEVPGPIQEAFDELNRVIFEYKQPLSWIQGKYRAEL